MTVLTPGCGPNAPIVAGKDARAGTYQTKPTGKVLHTFTLHNTSTTASTRAAARLGLAFLKEDVPKGKKLAVWVKGGRRVPFAAAAATNSWADDSLRSTADGGMVLLDGSLGPGQSRTYEVYMVNGTATASGFDPFAWLAAHGNDLTVAVTGRTGSATGAKPDLLFSLKTAIATTTRREILCDTDRFVRIKAWQKVPQEEHLICEYHVDFWLDEAGAPFGLEFAPVLSQHWWVADPFGKTQTKERYTYDAVVKYGTTVLDSRSRLDHAYYCRWASLRPQDDAQHARKHWIGLGVSQMPTVRVQYDDSSLKRMMKAGYIPPLRLGVNYTGDTYTPATTYAPLGTNGHRSYIPASGAYPGRGIWGDPDAKLVCRQAQGAALAEHAWRVSRVMAQAGMSVYIHVRDHRLASGINGGSDAPNDLIPQIMTKVPSETQVYAGLGSTVVYAWNSVNNSTGAPTLVHSAPTGGTGAMSGFDDAHLHNYSAPTAFLEGEAYLGEAAVSLFNGSCFQSHFNIYAHDGWLMYAANSVRKSTQSIPEDTNGTIPYINGQERGFAWTLNIMNHAHMVLADARPAQAIIKNMARSVNYWLSKSYDYLPANHRSKGVAYIYDLSYQFVAPWQTNWQGMAAYQSKRLYDFMPANARGMNGFEEAAQLAARYVIGAISAGPYGTTAYRSLFGTNNGCTTLVPSDEPNINVSVTFANTVGTATPTFGLAWQNGDKVRFGPYNSSNVQQAAPTGANFTTLYHMVNVSGDTFQLASTPVGVPISVGNSTVECFITMQAFSGGTVGPSGTRYWPDDDDYSPIAFALFEQAVGERHPDLSYTVRDNARAWFGPKRATFSKYAAWNYDGNSLL